MLYKMIICCCCRCYFYYNYCCCWYYRCFHDLFVIFNRLAFSWCGFVDINFISDRAREIFHSGCRNMPQMTLLQDSLIEMLTILIERPHESIISLQIIIGVSHITYNISAFYDNSSCNRSLDCSAQHSAYLLPGLTKILNWIKNIYLNIWTIIVNISRVFPKNK